MKKGLRELYPRLWRVCMGITGREDWAEDLAQAACLRALEKHNLFEEGTRLDSWLFRIADRIWIDELRKRNIRTGAGLIAVEDAHIEAENNDPSMNIFLGETLEEIMKLPEAQRKTMTLVYLEEFSYKEAAEIMDIPIGTVMSRLSIARKRLSETLDYKYEAI